jgi:hypothetical protein
MSVNGSACGMKIDRENWSTWKASSPCHFIHHKFHVTWDGIKSASTGSRRHSCHFSTVHRQMLDENWFNINSFYLTSSSLPFKIFWIWLLITNNMLVGKRARGSVVALCYKPEGSGFETPTRWNFKNVPNPSGGIRPWGLLSL